LEPSPWFTPSPVGETPPHGRVTWLAGAEPERRVDRIAVACVDPAGRATLARTVFVAR
jgi:hypothetical protein